MRAGKKRMLTTTVEYAKHLRPLWKRVFWKGERQAQKKFKESEIKASSRWEKY